MRLTIPAYVLIDALAGRQTLKQAYGSSPLGDQLFKCVDEGWSITACSFENGNIQQARAANVVLELVLPHDRVFWP